VARDFDPGEIVGFFFDVMNLQHSALTVLG